MSMKQLQFRHNCQNLGCSDTACPQCKLSQKRRCVGNFSSKYLAPCDVVEAKCGAQIYVVVVDSFSGELMLQGLEDAFLELAVIDGKKFVEQGGREDCIDSCKLLLNKQGQPLLAHGRSGSYSDDKHIVVPMIHGQAMLPDLKVTESSEALLSGRAPPFRLMARAIWRTGERVAGIAPVLSEPFVVATARVKGAAKVDIPHVEDHISKLEGLGLQTQKKLEDIAAAATAVGVHSLAVPINTITKVGQFKELVEIAEGNKPLRETLKQVLRLTKGWDIAKEHVMKAVNGDVALRVYHPDGRNDVGLVFKCGAYNVVDVQHPIGLLRRRPNPQIPNQDLVDVIWLPNEATCWPDAVRRLVPRAAAAWWNDGHPGWNFLPLSLSHVPAYHDDGNPSSSMSSFTFTKTTGTAAGQESAAEDGNATNTAANASAIANAAIADASPASLHRPQEPQQGFAPVVPSMLLPTTAMLPPSAFGLVGPPPPVLMGQQQPQIMPDASVGRGSSDEAFQRMLQTMMNGGEEAAGGIVGAPEVEFNGPVATSAGVDRGAVPMSGDSIEISSGKTKRKADGSLQDLTAAAAGVDINKTRDNGAPAPKLSGATMKEMRRMFGKAARQEISYDELERFLKSHDLMPVDGEEEDELMVDTAPSVELMQA